MEIPLAAIPLIVLYTFLTIMMTALITNTRTRTACYRKQQEDEITRKHQDLESRLYRLELRHRGRDEL